MKQFKLTFLLTILMSMVGASAFAYDIAVENDDFVTIYYNYINGNKELEVANPITIYYSGVVNIPKKVNYNEKIYSVTSIGDYAFSRCTNLSITIPNSVTNIGEGAFKDCSGLTSITIPNSVTNIGVYAFWNCSSLTSVTIPNSVTNIGDRMFEDCSGLTSVTIGNSVTSIGLCAFQNCRGLISITIPNGVTSIGGGAFNQCKGLTSVVSLIEEPFDIDNNVFSDGPYNNATLYVPDGTIDKYKATESWNRFVNIEEGATGINDIKEDLSKQYRYYDLNGNQSLQPRKGVNIVRMSNGKTKKVVVK